MKYAECPMCHQPMVDLNNDLRFVNHNPGKPDIQEPVRINLNEYPNPYCSEPGDFRSDVPPSSASFDSPINRGVERGLSKPKGEPKADAQGNGSPVVNKLNLVKKEESKDIKKKKLRDVWEEWY